MFNILITSPSLDENKNVSGISTIVKTIIVNDTQNQYFHFKLGRDDYGPGKIKWLINQFLVFPNLIYFIRKNKINIVHLNTPLEKSAIIRDFFVFMVVRYLFSLKVLIHIHGGYMLMQPPARRSVFFIMIKKILKRASGVLVLSDIEKDRIYKDYEIDCLVLANGIKANEVVERDASQFEGKINISFLGRIVKSKGIFLIAETLSQLRDYHEDFHFNIYGVGPDQDVFLKQIAGIHTLNYTYHGVVKDTDKWRALTDTQLFLLPSIYGEGLPIAMLEAMSLGCIPVVSNDASMLSVVEDGISGYIVQKGDQQQLSDKLRYILNNRSMLYPVSRNASKRIYENYNVNSYLDRLRNIYQIL